MKLTPRLTLIFIAYASALLIGVGLLAYESGRNALREATISELQATALEKESSLDRWVQDKASDIAALAADPTLIQETMTLTQAEPGSSAALAAHDTLIENLAPYRNPGEFLEISLIDPRTGQVLASTNPDEEGKYKEDQPYFLNGKKGPFVQNLYYSVALQAIDMAASAPLQTPDGHLLGVLAARLDLAEMNAIINRRTGLHKTDDAYLVNTSSLFVTQPRFIGNPSILQRGIHTAAIDRCLKQESGVIEAPDYHDVPAFVVYRWLADRNLCLIVKLDQTEAYLPIRAFGGTIAGISAIALLAAAALAFALARSLTRPILALQTGAARFGRGELNVRLDEVSKDELGQLAVEFNQMAQALTEQQTHLRRHAEQFFNLSPDLLCTVDSASRIQDLNPAWELTLGYPAEELKGRLLTNIVHPDDLALTRSALKRVVSEGSVRFENRCRHKKGNYCWLAWVVTSSQDHLLYAAARDVTERRLAEEWMRQQKEELERSNRELEEFAYVASHDLQEPLQLVSSHIQLLARRYQGRLDQDADEFIDFAMEGTTRLKSLISDLLEYSKVGTSDREFAPVDMETIFARVMETYQPIVDDCKGQMTHDPLPIILGDQEQMVQLLHNLIDNSIKFRGKEPPRIHVGARQMSERWLFFVRDNGIGIDAQYTDKVFVIFQRLHSRDDYPGTGIGLAISRKVIERHGGHIWVDSEPGKGATFYFTLQPVEGWQTAAARPETVPQRQKDTIADRATDLI
ncbi:MAG: ATP-binding protein [Bacteroidota bacterium]